jgi:plasmid maintenance system antidote protein VapI
MSKQPKNPFHVGEILLEEFLVPMGELKQLLQISSDGQKLNLTN